MLQIWENLFDRYFYNEVVISADYSMIVCNINIIIYWKINFTTINSSYIAWSAYICFLFNFKSSGCFDSSILNGETFLKFAVVIASS